MPLVRCLFFLWQPATAASSSIVQPHNSSTPLVDPAGLASGSPDASSIELSDLREALLLLLRSAAGSAAFGGRISFVRVCVIGLSHENDCSFVCVIGLRHLLSGPNTAKFNFARFTSRLHPIFTEFPNCMKSLLGFYKKLKKAFWVLKLFFHFFL